MNRDEKRSRVAAFPPQILHFDQTRAILPREPKGGTWIAVNDAGTCFALINWHRIQREPAGDIVSRGDVILRLVHASSEREITEAISKLPLPQLRPFRLIAIVASERRVTEWQWDLCELKIRPHGWKRQHWFSSGFDELRAETERQQICQSLAENTDLDIKSLRGLHQSHRPQRGPFSICMHRSDAKTVSYAEIVLEKDAVIMRYQPDSPCANASFTETVLPIRQIAVAQ